MYCQEYKAKGGEDKPLTKIELGEYIREKLHNIDILDKDDRLAYDEMKQKFITLLEGEEKSAYDDDFRSYKLKYIKDIVAAGLKPRGKITIGVGFNMQASKAENIWNKIFGTKLSFQDVKSGKIKITKEQSEKLLVHSLLVREKELKTIYGDSWNKLRPNEKIAIESAYFNHPSFIDGSTKFYKNIKKYTETADPKHLKDAVWELGENSGKIQPELLERRKAEAAALNSTNASFYVKPGEGNFPKNSVKVIEGKTFVPRGIEKTFNAKEKSEYFIWRTRLASNVRPGHMIMEGQICKYSEYPNFGEHGCKCRQVDIPKNSSLLNHLTKSISFEHWIRYGGASSIEIKWFNVGHP